MFFSFERNQITFLEPSENNPINLRINIIADYTFLENKYGEVNKNVQTYSYEVTETNLTPSSNVEFSCSTSNSALCNKINHREIASAYTQDLTIGNSNFTSDTTIYANNVTISGNISSSNGASVNIKVFCYLFVVLRSLRSSLCALRLNT